MKLIVTIPEILYDTLKYEKKTHRIEIIKQDSSPYVKVALPVTILKAILNGKIIEDSYDPSDYAYRDIVTKKRG